METQTLVAIVAVGGALAGSAVGGAISFLSSRAIRRFEVQLSLQQKEIERRMTLYASFVAESNRVVLEPVAANEPLGRELVVLASLQSQIDITSEQLGGLAMRVLFAVLDETTNKRRALRGEEPLKLKEEPYPRVRDMLISAFRIDLAQLKRQV